MKPIKRKVLLSDSHLCARERVCSPLISSVVPFFGTCLSLVSLANGQRNVVVGLGCLILCVCQASVSARFVACI